MINFSNISCKSFIGITARNFLRRVIPREYPLPILQGMLKGKKWIVGSGALGYLFGTYELNKQKRFQEIVKEGQIVFDIGSHYGFYSLLAAEFVGLSGKVFAFEPMPENFNHLEKHIKINNYQNIFTYQVAVSNYDGTANFQPDKSSFGGLLNEKGELKVNVVSLDKLELPVPDVIKIDVEGEELKVLEGARNLLTKYKPRIFLATHLAPEERIKEKCKEFLEKIGYRVEEIGYGEGELYAY